MNALPRCLGVGVGILTGLVCLSGCTDRSVFDRSDGEVDTDMTSLPALDEIRGIRDLAPTPAGAVWIVNGQSPVLVRQGADGQVTAAFGAPGNGPGELGFVAGIVAATDTSITVLDRGRRLIRTFGEEGNELAATPVGEVGTEVPSDLGETLTGSPFKIARDIDGGAFITSDYPRGRAPGTAHLWNRTLVSIAPDGATLERIDFTEHRDRLADRLGGAAILAPAPLWAHCPGKGLAVYLPFDDELTWMSSSEVVVVPTSTRPIERSELETTVVGRLLRGPGAESMDEAEARAMLPAVMEQLEPELSATAPAYTEMLCDGGGRVWLQEFSVDDDWMGRASSADVLDPAGTWQTVALPPRFRMIIAQGDTIVGVLSDDLDVERVAFVTIAPGGD